MSSKATGLLAQIEAGLLDDSTAVSSLLQKVIVLGGKAGSEKMRDWARQELNGYAHSDIPQYRKLRVPLYARITNRAGYNPISQLISRSLLPKALDKIADVELLNLGTGVGELEAMVEAGDRTNEPHRLSPVWADVLVNFLNKHGTDEFSKVSFLYWDVPNASIKGVLVQVRMALAELVAELVSMTPEGQDIPTQLAADSSIQFIVTGERPVINVTSQHTATGPNVSAQSSESAVAVAATGGGTAIGQQTASGDNASVAGTQSTHGHNAAVSGHSSAPPAAPGERRGFWRRLREWGLFVAFFTVIGGIAAIVSVIVAVLDWLDWTPW